LTILETEQKQIPFYVLPKLSESQIEHITNEVAKVMRTGQITNGLNVRQLEERTKQLHGVDYAVACSSATQGMWIALKTLKIKAIMVQAFTWKSLQYILPSETFFCDINKNTWLMNQQSNDLNALIVTHTFGNTDLAEQNSENQTIIYDGAYSLGADLPEIGDATVLSLTATKTVTSCEGGLILTNNRKLANEAEEIRDKCSRMSELNAIVGLTYCGMLDEILAKKKRIFDYYNAHLPFRSQKTSRYGTNYGFYGCLVPNRDVLLDNLKRKVDVRIRYEPLQKGFPATDEIASKIVILPCYPDLDPSTVVNYVNEVT
jgi:dTDP-4-amino-4,6-dideoxygalactose transaminase